MILNSNNTNKTNNHFLTELTEHEKDHDLWRWCDRHENVARFNRLMGHIT
jgi:oligoribonuclease NrnB/cAMP/cGMP phosphodiesterase (DHH superfamily)